MEAVSATTRIMLRMMADRAYRLIGDPNNYEGLVDLMCTESLPLSEVSEGKAFP
jgi:hypothetical protein